MYISFYLTRPQAKEATTIFARFIYAGNKFKYYTPERINPKYWNNKKLAIKGLDTYPEFNQRLKDWKSNAENIYRKWVNDNGGKEPNPETLKKLFDRELKKIEPTKEIDKTFFGFFQQIIDLTINGKRLQPETGKPFSKATIQVYKNTLNRLKAYSLIHKGKIDFDTITLDFYTDFTGYLAKELKLASNTIGKDIKTIKTILNEATERGINKNLQYKIRKFSVTREDTDAIYLNTQELKSLEHLDLSNNAPLERVRDLFLVGCNTGLRFSDCSKLTPTQIKDGFIEITPIKTGKPISIPVHDTVQRILNKYNGELPKAISNQKTNEYLKVIGKKLDCLKINTSKTFTKGGLSIVSNYEKWEALCTHTARRSFATNEYLGGMPSISIMAITGHKTERAFLRYIKLTPKEHAILMKQHWERNKLKAV